jgi:hypothetical protein
MKRKEAPMVPEKVAFKPTFRILAGLKLVLSIDTEVK